MVPHPLTCKSGVLSLCPVALKNQWDLKENQATLLTPWAWTIGSSAQNQVPLHCPFRPQRQLCAPVVMVIQPRIARASQMFLVYVIYNTILRSNSRVNGGVAFHHYRIPRASFEEQDMTEASWA